jgi:hypothetical protein
MQEVLIFRALNESASVAVSPAAARDAQEMHGCDDDSPE